MWYFPLTDVEDVHRVVCEQDLWKSVYPITVHMYTKLINTSK